MAFYIKPPEGVVSLASLERFGIKRLLFLKEVLKCDGSEGFRRLVSEIDTAIDSECLIEGSKRDRTSHFLLRLVCCEDNEMFNFLLQAETELFGYRFSSMNTQELFHFLKSTHKFVTRCLNFKTCANDDNVCNLQMALDMVFSATGSWQAIVEKYMNDCSTETFQIPFQLALSLIAGRQVDLKNGLASVPFSKLHVVLSSLFHTLLKEGLRKAAVVCNDAGDREIKLVQSLQLFCQKLLGSPHPRSSILDHCFLSDQIDEEVVFFPPCMKHLHRVLRQRHRLRHHSRVQYTLYLKEIGLPPDEALVFWKREYSQPEIDRYGNSVKCRNTWQKDNKRYTYNIRHLYGLEGARTNYSAHSCKFLQMYTPGPGEEGGCPFSQSDDSYLQTFMDIEEVGKFFQGDILSHSKNRQYTEACRKFFISKVNHEVTKILPTLGSGEQGNGCLDDTETRGDGLNIAVPPRGETSIDYDSTIMKEHFEYCRHCKATGRLLEPEVRFGGIQCQCSKAKVSRTTEYNSKTLSKNRFEYSYNNVKVHVLQGSHSFQSARTQCKGKCAISKRNPNVCKRRKVSHSFNDEGKADLNPKDSGYESVADSMLSVPKVRSFTVLQFSENADKEFGQQKRPLTTDRTERAGENRFVKILARSHDADVHRKDIRSQSFENEGLEFTDGHRAESDGHINKVVRHGNSDLHDDEVIFKQAGNFKGTDSNLNTPNERLDPGIVDGRQGFREEFVCNTCGNVGSKTDVSRNNDYGKVKPVAINDGATQQLYQNVRTQDIRKPSDFYTSFRKIRSELKKLKEKVKSAT
ncbi:DNA primase large subunit [Holothuria leucospilota]|uniref:DNA primase large subunit n=1 Tax=Holothuria leucospilota TaxID=206669 RepID=A0A9Q0YE14_HOLLE|nr:DNA primase large subunit [Holothuria leucospilota]